MDDDAEIRILSTLMFLTYTSFFFCFFFLCFQFLSKMLGFTISEYMEHDCHTFSKYLVFQSKYLPSISDWKRWISIEILGISKY